MAPGARDEPEPEEEWATESTTMAKIRTAYDKGAAGGPSLQSGCGGTGRRRCPRREEANRRPSSHPGISSPLP